MAVAAGSDTQIQYNTAGDLDASEKFTWENDTATLTLVGEEDPNNATIRGTGDLFVTSVGITGLVPDGNIYLHAGYSGNNTTPSDVAITASYGNSTVAAGGVLVTGGQADDSNQPNAGNVTIIGGYVNHHGTGSTGSVTIESPQTNSPNGDTGGVTIRVGAAQGTGQVGDISLITYGNGNNGGAITFSTSGGERARLSPAGQLLLGTLYPQGVSGTPLLEIAASTGGISPRCFTMSTDSNVQFIGDFWNKSSTSGNFVRFGTGTSTFAQRGSITYSNGTTNYNTTSDAELKTDITDSKTAGDVVDKIKVRSFKWKDTGKKVDYWVLAQELYPVCPTAVTPGSKTSFWEVDVSKLVPVLVKEVQELRARVAKLEKKK